MHHGRVAPAASLLVRARLPPRLPPRMRTGFMPGPRSVWTLDLLPPFSYDHTPPAAAFASAALQFLPVCAQQFATFFLRAVPPLPRNTDCLSCTSVQHLLYRLDLLPPSTLPFKYPCLLGGGHLERGLCQTLRPSVLTAHEHGSQFSGDRGQDGQRRVKNCTSASASQHGSSPSSQAQQHLLLIVPLPL